MRVSVLPLSTLLLLMTAACTASTTGTREGDATRGGASTPSDGSASDGTSAGTTASGGKSDTSSAPSSYDALFDAPADPTTTDGTLGGLWAGETYYADARIKLSANEIVVALKCGSDAAVGLDVGAQITASSIKILASKSVGAPGSACAIKVSPQVISRCTTQNEIGCFVIEGTTLQFIGIALFESGSSPKEAFTKLSD